MKLPPKKSFGPGPGLSSNSSGLSGEPLLNGDQPQVLLSLTLPGCPSGRWRSLRGAVTQKARYRRAELIQQLLDKSACATSRAQKEVENTVPHLSLPRGPGSASVVSTK